MRIVMAGALALVLAACGETPYDPEASEDAPATLEGDVRLVPGLYRMQVSIGGEGGGAAGSQFADDTQCLTASDVENGYREMLLDMQGRGSCSFSKYTLEGEELDAVMVCKGDGFQPETEARIAGTVTPESTDLRMTVAGFENGQGGLDMQVTSERIGECEAEGK